MIQRQILEQILSEADIIIGMLYLIVIMVVGWVNLIGDIIDSRKVSI